MHNFESMELIFKLSDMILTAMAVHIFFDLSREFLNWTK